MAVSELDNLVKDCMTHRLSYTESMQYIEQRSGKKISLSTFKRKKAKFLSEPTLNEYFNYHTRIGFVEDQRDRKNEMESVMSELMRRWKQQTSKENVDIYRLTKLSDSIVNANKRLEEISLSNPVISKIKMEVDKAENTTTGTASPEGDSLREQAIFN